MSDKRKREARAIMAETGWSYTRALQEADRRHAEAQARDGNADHDDNVPRASRAFSRSIVRSSSRRPAS